MAVTMLMRFGRDIPERKRTKLARNRKGKVLPPCKHSQPASSQRSDLGEFSRSGGILSARYGEIETAEEREDPD